MWVCRCVGERKLNIAIVSCCLSSVASIRKKREVSRQADHTSNWAKVTVGKQLDVIRLQTLSVPNYVWADTTQNQYTRKPVI